MNQENNNELQQNEEDNLPSTVYVLQTLLNRWKFIIIATVVCSAISIGVVMVIPHTYRAYAKIIANDSKSGGMNAMMTALPSFITSGASGSIAVMTVGEILSSRSNAEYVIESCKLDSVAPYKVMTSDEKVDAVMSVLVSDPKRQSGVILLECTLKTPWFPTDTEVRQTAQRAADMCNASIEGLDKLNKEKNVSTARRTRQYIERVLVTTKSRRDSLQQVLVQFQKANKVLTTQLQSEALLTGIVSVGSELAKAQTELRLAQQEYSSNTPMIDALKSKVATLQDQYNRSQTGGSNSGDKYSIPLSNIPTIQKTNINLVAELKILESLIMYLETQRLQESIQEERDLPTVQVVDAAKPPLKRTSPARVSTVIAATVIGFIISCFYIIYEKLLTIAFSLFRKKK